jgi:hypothetical protein
MMTTANNVLVTFRPKDGSFVIQTEGMRVPKDLIINLFDSTGKRVEAILNTENIAGNLMKLCIAGVPAGIYHLQLMSQYFMHIKRVVLA